MNGSVVASRFSPPSPHPRFNVYDEKRFDGFTASFPLFYHVRKFSTSFQRVIHTSPHLSDDIFGSVNRILADLSPPSFSFERDGKKKKNGKRILLTFNILNSYPEE